MNDLRPLNILPGLYTLPTDRGAKGRWKDGDKVRFRQGYPEKLGGWQKNGATTFVGKCRSLIDWQSHSFSKLIGLGTHLKLYIYSGATYVDITPIRDDGTLGLNPFTTANGSALVSVADVAHGLLEGDYVHFSGAAAVNGITINGEYTVTSVTSANAYVITHSAPANGNGAGGGAAVAYEYEISVGAEASTYGFGWGAGGFGRSTWGTARSLSTFLTMARIWSLDQWGEDMIASPRGGGIYVWDTSVGTGTRATVISGAPSSAKAVMVSMENQHLIALGAHDGSADDPMLIRWSSSEDYTSWTASATNSAGQKRLNTGNEIMCGVKGDQDIRIFTDSYLWTMTFVGPPAVFAFDSRGGHGGLRGPNAACHFRGRTYWMGENDFFYFDGAIRRLECDVHPTVFKNLNFAQKAQTFCGINNLFAEIWWFYCSETATEPDRYVIFNVDEKLWSFGTIARTAYIGDSDILPQPYAAASDGYIYDHEIGVNDDTTAITASLESGDLELGEGEGLLILKGVVPDFKELEGTIYLTVTGRKYPQKDDTTSKGPYSIESDTPFVKTRLKARQVSVALESSAVNDHWRMGPMRVDVKAFGKR